MEWWQLVVSFASVGSMGILGWGLLEIVKMKSVAASIETKMENIHSMISLQQKELIKQAEKHARADERFGWGASKINALSQGIAVLRDRVRKLEEATK